MTEFASPASATPRIVNTTQITRLLPDLVAGVLMGFIEVVIATSVASLIFSGPLSGFRARGIGLVLVSGAIALVVTALIGRVSGVIGSVQDSPGVLVAVIAGSLASQLAGTDALLPTVLTAIALSTLLTGALLLGVGLYRMGRLVRFIPYPVVGGFIAGTGWLIAIGSVGAMTDYNLTFANIPALLQPDQLILWLPGVAMAVVLFAGLKLIRHPLALPGTLVGLIALFYAGLLVTGTSIHEAFDRGLLLGMIGDLRWQPFNPAMLARADWSAIGGQAGNIGVLMGLSLVALLLNVTGLELALDEEQDFNQALRTAGIANILSGLAGGAIGYHALGLSVFSHRVGGRGKLPGLIAALVVVTVLIAGPALLAYFPRPLLGGILLLLGMEFLSEWIVDGWRRFSRAEYAIVLLILTIIALTDFVVGVAVGVVAMVILFAISYSRTSVVHHAYSGRQVQSNVERNPALRKVLIERGEQALILNLQGFLFFGTASSLLERIQDRLRDTELAPLRYVILDFTLVNGMDSSAALAFSKVCKLAAGLDIKLALTGTSPTIQSRLGLSALAPEERPQLFDSLDFGLEWYEEQVLDIGDTTPTWVPTSLSRQLQADGLNQEQARRLVGALEKMRIDTDHVLIRQGEAADSMYFIEVGQVSVYLELASGNRMRLRTLGMGTIVGEIGMYLGETRTASVIADTPAVVYRLTRENLVSLMNNQPELAAAFHEMLARMLSERLAMINWTLEATRR